MRFPEEFLNELKSRVRLSDVVGKKVQLKKRGKDWVGLSPFSSEKTPSFYVHDDRGFYKCFSTQKAGDAITFLTETERLTFAEAVEKLARDIMFVPESTLLPDLLIQMQQSRIHIAIVVDEFGGTGGMVCLEDLVEQIVGDIEDEHDETRPLITRRGRYSWEVDGLADIADVERETGLPLQVEDFESDVDTIGGLVTALAGRVPQAGELLEHPRGSMIEVTAADPRRVIRMRLKAPKPAPSALAEDKTAAVDR